MRNIIIKKLGRALCVSMAVMLCFLIGVSSFAGVATSAKAKAIMNEYDVIIKDDSGMLKTSKANYFLNEVEAGLEFYGAPFINELSDYIRTNYDADFTITLLAKPNNNSPLGEFDCDYYDDEDMSNMIFEIHLFDEKDASFGGITRDTFAHEAGHALYAFFQMVIGYDEIANMWSSINGSIQYDHDFYKTWVKSDYNKYARDYGKSDEFEDFATVVEEMILNQEKFLKRVNKGNAPVLQEKVLLLLTLCEQYLDNIPVAFESFYSQMDVA